MRPFAIFFVMLEREISLGNMIRRAANYLKLGGNRRKSLEEASRESEEKLRALIETADSGYILTDFEGTVIDCNDIYAGFSGYATARELIGRSLFEWTASRDLRKNVEIFKRIADEGFANKLLIDHINKSGATVPVEMNARVIRTSRGPLIQGSCRQFSGGGKNGDGFFGHSDFLQTLIDSIPVPVFYKDSDMLYQGCNSTLERFLGRPKEKIIEKSVYDISPKELADVYHAKDLELLGKPGTQTYEGKMINGQEELRDVVFHRATFANPDGTPGGLIGVIFDITEQKQMAHSLGRSEQLLKMITETIEDVFWVSVPETGETIYVSPAYEKIWGRNCESMYREPRSFLNGVHPDDREKLSFYVTGNPSRNWECEYRIIGPDGSERWIYGRGFAATDDVFKTPVVIMAATDITRRKLAEEALRDSETRLRTITDSARDAILVMDTKGMVCYWNTAAERTLGYTKEEAMGRDLHRLIAPERYHGAHDAAFPGFLATGRGEAVGKTLELIACRKDGEEIPVELSLEKAFMSGWHAVGILRDISERKQAEEDRRQSRIALERMNEQLEKSIDRANTMALKAEMANTAKTQFPANMSHEIRTPMNGVLGMLESLLKTGLNDQQNHCAQTAHTSAEALLKILNDILELSKIETERLELDPQPMNLRKVVEDAVRLIVPRIDQKDVEVVVDYRTSEPEWFIGDELRIRQVLTNLLGNGVKFTAQGHVSIAVHCARPEGLLTDIHVSVRDTGIGIPREAMESLFDPFVQADGSITRNLGGAGLGLAISKRLTALMGGRIWAESEPGKGSTFHCTFSLPVVGNEPVDPGLPAGLPGEKAALVIEKNPVSRKVLGEMLEDRGIKCITAESMAAALNILKKLDAGFFGLFIIDARSGMETGGVEPLEKLRKETGTRTPAVIMLPYKYCGQEGVLPEDIGSCSIICKPATRSELSAAILAAAGIGKSVAGKKEPDGASPFAQARRLKILLAEDNIVNQEVAKEFLKAMGHEVYVVSSGDLAVQGVRESIFDLILMDVQMPVMGGYEATRQIRALERGGHIPIIAMTAHAFKQDRQRCIDEGMDDYIGKPISGKRLADVINRWSKGAIQSRPSSTVPVTVPVEDQSLTVDVKDFLMRCEGRAKMALRLLDVFIESTPEILEKLEVSVHSQELNEATLNAHQLKGAAATISAFPLSEACADLEESCRNGDNASAATHLGDVISRFNLFMNTVVAIRGEIEKSG